MGKLDTLKRIWKVDKSNFFSAVFNNVVHTGLLNFLSDEKFIKIAYRMHMGKKLNLENPQTFNEKLQWLKLYDRNLLYTRLVDKYAVKEYVGNKIGVDRIIPTLGVWEKVKEINFEVLPEQFVLKCNHDSGGIVICKDRAKLDVKSAKRKLFKCMKRNGYWYGREWPYKAVKPRVIAEQYMEDSTGELRDYKFFCFDGRVRYFKVDFDRFTNHRANYFDREGNLLPFGEEPCPPDYNAKIELPNNLQEMIKFAEMLSENIKFVRVDFYNVNGKIYFGEMTFFPASGFWKFVPEEYDSILGEYLMLPKEK